MLLLQELFAANYASVEWGRGDAWEPGGIGGLVGMLMTLLLLILSALDVLFFFLPSPIDPKLFRESGACSQTHNQQPPRVREREGQGKRDPGNEVVKPRPLDTESNAPTISGSVLIKGQGTSTLLGYSAFFQGYAMIPVSPTGTICFGKRSPKFEGVLEINNILTQTQRLYEGELVGPESIAADSTGTLYTGLADGRIVKLEGGKVIDVVSNWQATMWDARA
ncbi:hypothetical protein OS493_012708 [Desmophyllum pertusum]|uniref:Uncharacterized protein n=1 Tax=Desmophyllum pertusum TaxID=174260 RepID=A0A9X0CY89_9CNID|nr:hypothetical protein OS493_012708 [Desmophyllum pertusum]